MAPPQARWLFNTARRGNLRAGASGRASLIKSRRDPVARAHAGAVLGTPSPGCPSFASPRRALTQPAPAIYALWRAAFEADVTRPLHVAEEARVTVVVNRQVFRSPAPRVSAEPGAGAACPPRSCRNSASTGSEGRPPGLVRAALTHGNHLPRHDRVRRIGWSRREDAG
jgi:hypothetical protein